MKRYLYITLIIFSFTYQVVWGQNYASSKAKNLEDKYYYLDAGNYYAALIKSGDKDANLKLALNLYKARLFEDALPYFVQADSLQIINDNESLFAYFECLKSVKRYEDADKLMSRHLIYLDEHLVFATNADRLRYYDKIQKYQGAEITTLNLNSKYSDMAPVVHNNLLYFVSTRPTTNNKDIHRINMQPFYNLYAVHTSDLESKVIKPEGKFDKPAKQIKIRGEVVDKLPDGINKRYHDGPVSISANGNYLFITTNWSHEKTKKSERPYINLRIYYSILNDGIWGSPLNFPYNSNEWSNQHAYFDESTSTVYYSSNQPGGYGGYDIWKSTLSENGWTEPINLGKNINTEKDEVFPGLTPDGQLFFSSNGWPGLGGLDVFLSDSEFIEPLNLLNGINSEKDDFALTFRDQHSGYFTSNRNGTIGDDDIFQFTFNIDDVKKYMRPAEKLIVGVVRDENTGEVLDNVKITLSGYINKDYTLSENNTLEDKVSEKDFIRSDNKIWISYMKDGYESKEVSIDSWPDDLLTLDISNTLVKTKLPLITITNDHKFIIYFDFDKFNIRSDAAEILAKVTYVLLEEYEMAEVHLTGHTDSRGTNNYNDKLSKNRAEAAKKWLITKGISKDRIKINYLGKTSLAINCNDSTCIECNPDKCLSAEQHQLNRRVEIEIKNMD
jgi:outer membrane protein OmpA-like peptidoglycan-associated protein